MLLFSWNVNGLRAVMKKGFPEILAQSGADVFCLQETKLSPEVEEFVMDGYQSYWNHADKKGYSGTGIYTRLEPLRVSRGIGVDVHDHEGRVLTLEFENFFLVNVYTPNSQNQLARLDYRMEWEVAFKEYVCQLAENKPVVICGDLNVAHEEVDIKNPATNHNNPGFTDRERQAMSSLLEAGFTDTFRLLHPAEQKFSWWSYRYGARKKNIGWRIDYFLVSNTLVENLNKAEIHNDIEGSDHCPVSVELSF